MPTPLGAFGARFTARGLARLVFPPDLRGTAARAPVLRDQEGKRGRRLARELDRFARGRPVRFGVPLDLSGGTAFQRGVWRALSAIPRGRVRSYAWLARRAGSPRACRAAGSACGANPVPVLVPCHRAVASNGPGGFGPGLAWKRRLLALEGFELNRKGRNR